MTSASAGPVALLLIFNVLQVVALYSILIGLIGTKKINERPTPMPKFLIHGDSKFPLEYAATVDKIAIVVIDAMRVDFLQNYDMPFLSQLLAEGIGCVHVCNVKTPTVTLPRIKALVTGDISSYWDVIQNFYSSRLTQDNFIHRAKQERNKTIVFYGDDTWTKLFPEGFDRAEGVNSFYVTDFTEVDWNVTRHLDDELSQLQPPWDMMVLHYLGLDHIGHVHGLKAPALIQTKLHEMDAVIRRAYNFLQEHSHSTLPSHLIVTGDHGMANVGGHGSNSQPEVTTPFILLSTKQKQVKCRGNNENGKDMPEVEQVDIATTISLLWGLQIPSASLGKLIPGSMEMEAAPPTPSSLSSLILAAMHYNAMHLRNLANSGNTGHEGLESVISRHAETLTQTTFNESSVLELVEAYSQLLPQLSAEATAATISEQNLAQILLGLGMLLACFAATTTVFTSLSSFRSIRRIRLSNSGSGALLLLHLLAPFVIYFSSSFVEEEHFIRHYLWATCIAVHFFCIGECNNGDGKLRYPWRKCAVILGCVTAHRLASTWNSTGQKWTHLASISDAIQLQPEHMTWVVFGGALPLIVYVEARTRMQKRHWSSSITFPATFLFVALVKYWTSTAFFGFHNETLERVALCVIALQALAGRGLLSSWVLLTTLLHRFENIPLVALELVQLELVSSLTSKDQSGKTLLYLWFGWTSFFYQGNSNNIATVDINAGYVGQTNYSPAIVGGLIFCNIFSAPALQMFHFRDQDQLGSDTTYWALLTIASGYNSVVYTLALLLFRKHLFIWSVFTPKLLYVIGFMLLNCLMLIIMNCVHLIYASFGLFRVIKV